MDLSAFQFEESARMPVRSPLDGVPIKDDAGEDMFIEVYGYDSDAYRRVMFEIQKEMSRAATGNEDAFQWREDRTVKTLSRLIRGWNVQMGSNHIEFTEENAVAVLSEHKWLRDQVDRFIHERGNFMRASSTS